MYTERQSRVAKAFCHSATLCAIECSHCGRTHFVSALGHGDYEEGELELYKAKAAAEPDRYVEETFHDSIDWGYWNGKQFVPDCPCGIGDKIAEAIDPRAHQLAAYLKLYFEVELSRLRLKAKDAQDALDGLTESQAALEKEQEQR